MEDMTFEQAMKRLEEIVTQLEAGEAPLDKSMALFEEGTKLSAYLSGLLDRAEQKVTMVTTQNGEEVEVPFDAQEGE
ncbi:exodeoxyribonuclease VII small subunit [Butyricicoccus sp.]|uniref:exodeoxyribonuclease VII small subunit n=1 Tax=Butyricicoccus sp. TaxID=2049021 RepID=UPI0037365E65